MHMSFFYALTCSSSCLIGIDAQGIDVDALDLMYAPFEELNNVMSSLLSRIHSS